MDVVTLSEWFAAVTPGQAIVLVAGVFVGLHLLGCAADAVRRALGLHIYNVDGLLEEVERVREVVEGRGGDQVGELERIREVAERVEEVLGEVDDGPLGRAAARVAQRHVHRVGGAR